MSRDKAQDDALDDALWQQLTQSVDVVQNRRLFHPLAGKARPLKSVKTPKKLAKPDQAQHQTSHPNTPKSPLAQPTDLRLGEKAGLDMASRRRLTSGKYDIDARIDLHGLRQDEAHRQLINFVQSAALRDCRTLLIITGKGRQGQGVLRENVPFWLKQPPLSGLILAINEATLRDGGSGALYVRLRRKRTT